MFWKWKKKPTLDAEITVKAPYYSKTTVGSHYYYIFNDRQCISVYPHAATDISIAILPAHIALREGTKECSSMEFYKALRTAQDELERIIKL